MILPVTCNSVQKIQLNLGSLKFAYRIASTKVVPQTVLLEEPIIILRDELDINLIGPPDSVSNLRPIVRRELTHETLLQKKFRETADATQKWNQNFWTSHNMNFIKEKQNYIKENTTSDKPQLNADEMSEFYKYFLDKHWENHVHYNFNWYRKNFLLLYLAMRVSIEKIHNRIL